MESSEQPERTVAVSPEPDETGTQTPPVTEQMDIADNSAMGKIKALLGMLTRFMGVKDIVNL